jgi:uncharacterized protein (TIGR02147 family)
MENEPQILEYQDYRDYLKDLYEYRKNEYPRYSYRKLASDFGFKPTNFFYLIIQRKRNLSFEALHRILAFSKFNAKDKRYFKALVNYNQADDPSEKESFLKELHKIKVKKSNIISESQFSYFKNWYTPVIRELISLKGFVPNLSWISKKIVPKLTESNIKDTLTVLEKLNMIKRVGRKWVQLERHLATSIEVTSEILGRYHEQLLGLSMASLEYDPNDRDIGSMTMSLSRDQFDWMVRRVREFREEVQEELRKQDESPSMVYQLNMQLFPVTKSLDK